LKLVMSTKKFLKAMAVKIQLVPSSNDHERFIDGLEEIIRSKL
jgi:protoheme ferro-lyase